MRFSAIFQLPAVPPQQAAPTRPALEREAAAVQEAARTAPPADLPDELDARVRMVGEWQLGEAC